MQTSQPATGHDTGILFRSCASRSDYVGGRNHFVSLDLLHESAALATPGSGLGRTLIRSRIEP